MCLLQDLRAEAVGWADKDAVPWQVLEQLCRTVRSVWQLLADVTSLKACRCPTQPLTSIAHS